LEHFLDFIKTAPVKLCTTTAQALAAHRAYLSQICAAADGHAKNKLIKRHINEACQTGFE
tara:strand:- start:516 stop:695 length:180 start_codon:yes stop_codon:yes gene_type:complete